jgi:hypothetical protein
VIQLGIWLGAIGAGDAVAGLSGHPASLRRALLGWGMASVVALAGAWAFALGPWTVLVLTVVTAATAGLWLVVRLPSPWSSRRAIACSLGALAAVVVSAALWGSVRARPAGPLERWMLRSSFVAVSRTRADRAVLIAGALIAMVATANALVRLILAAVGTEVDEPEARLRGGRIIGPMERLLILGFAVAGQLTAAAIVVSAKSLLRFPEISRSDRRIDAVTEYFLVGSMSSWLIALAPTVLLLR